MKQTPLRVHSCFFSFTSHYYLSTKYERWQQQQQQQKIKKIILLKQFGKVWTVHTLSTSHKNWMQYLWYIVCHFLLVFFFSSFFFLNKTNKNNRTEISSGSKLAHTYSMWHGFLIELEQTGHMCPSFRIFSILSLTFVYLFF